MPEASKRLVFLLSILCLAAYTASTIYVNKDSANEKPVITMEEDTITLSVKDSQDAILEGVTASDKEDGDVTGSLLLESLSNLDSDNQRKAVISAYDQNGNVTKATRTVIYKNYKSPTFKLNNPLTVQTTQLDSILTGVSVKDVLDGDISNHVQLETAARVVSDVTNDYKADLIVTNSAGDTVDIPVTITACTITDMAAAPTIELDTYLIYLKRKAKKPDWKSYLKSVTVSGRTWLWDDGFYLEADEDGTTPELRPSETALQSSDIKVKQDVDTSVPGVYEVDYFVRSYKKNPAAHVRLFVVVRE